MKYKFNNLDKYKNQVLAIIATVVTIFSLLIIIYFVQAIKNNIDREDDDNNLANDDIVYILEKINKETGLTFYEEQAIEFSWKTKDSITSKYKDVFISGWGLKFADKTENIELGERQIKKIFKNEKFSKNSLNSIKVDDKNIDAYKKDRGVCLVEGVLNNDKSKKQIEIKCGYLNE